MARRAVTPELGREIVRRVAKAADYYRRWGMAASRPATPTAACTTIEEKSLGAYAKSGSGPIHGIVKPGELVPTPRAVPARRRARWRAALGLPQHQRQRRDRRADRLRQPPGAVHHRPRLGRRLRHLAGHQGLRQPRDLPPHVRRHGRRRRPHPGGARRVDDVADELLDLVLATAAGAPTASEALGHQEFVLTYKPASRPGPRACRWRDDPVRGLRPGVPAADRGARRARGFHRAHQAVYADTLLRSGGRRERSGRSPCGHPRCGTRWPATDSSTTSWNDRRATRARSGRCWGSTSRPRGSSPRWPGSPTRRSRSSPSP